MAAGGDSRGDQTCDLFSFVKVTGRSRSLTNHEARHESHGCDRRGASLPGVVSVARQRHVSIDADRKLFTASRHAPAPERVPWRRFKMTKRRR